MVERTKESLKTPQEWQEAMEKCVAQLDRPDKKPAVTLGQRLLDCIELCTIDDTAVGRFFYRLGETLCLAGNNEEALTALTKSINVYEACQPDGFARGRAMAWASYCLLQVGRSGEASSLLKRALKVLEPFKEQHHEDWLWVAATYAHYCARSGRKRDALAMARKCLPLAHVDSERLLQTMKVCADISRNRSKLGEDAALVLQQLLDTRCKSIKEDTGKNLVFVDKKNTAPAGEPDSANDAEAGNKQVVTHQPTVEELLEDINGPSAKAWLKQRLQLSELALLSSRSRVTVHTRAVQLHAHSTYSDIIPRNDRIFYCFTPAQANKRHLMVCRTLTEFPKIVLKPSEYDSHSCMAFYQPSNSGKYVAYGLSSGGSDWKTVKIRHVDTGKDLTDSITDIRANYVSWQDDSGFFYQRCPKPKDNEKIDEKSVYFHKVGTDQSQDRLVFRSDTGTFASPWMVGGWLFICVYGHNDYKVRYFCRPESGKGESNGPFCVIPDRFGPNPTIVTFIDDCLYLIVFRNADRGKLIRYNVVTGKEKSILPESKRVLVRAAATRNNQLLVLAFNDCHTELTVHNRKDGRHLEKVNIPGVSHINFMGYTRADNWVFRVESYTQPPSIQMLDLQMLQPTEWLRYDIPFDHHRYRSDIVYCRSADGTKVPIYVCRNKDVRQSQSPVLINIYGGFQHSTVPHFDCYQAIWLEMGGTLAFVVSRGGIEYGLSWHADGAKENKPNVVADLFAARQYFISRGVPAARIGAAGDSNGGLIVTAALAQRPTAFGAVVVGNPLTDMLKFHKWYGGSEWIREYGDPEDPQVQSVLRQYSPLHNLESASYPPTMLQVSINDDRVHKSHSYKFFHRLEELNQSTAPILLRGYESSGHAQFGDYSYWYIDRLAFFVDHLKLDATSLRPLIKRDRNYEIIYNPKNR